MTNYCSLEHMRFDLGKLDPSAKSRNVSWRIVPSPWITEVSMFKSTSRASFLPNLHLPGRHESRDLDISNFFYVDIYLDKPVVLHKDFFDLAANIFLDSRESLLFSDYWVGSPNGTRSLHKLPKFSFERFLANDYLGPVLAVASLEEPPEHPKSRSELLHDLNANVLRLPLPTYETESVDCSTSLKYAHFAKSAQFLKENRVASSISEINESGQLDISYSGLAKGSVSIIIPTRGTKLELERVSMVEICLQSTIEQDLSGLDLEIVLVVDDDADKGYVETIKKLTPEDVKLKIVDFTPPFNFSKKCNMGFAESVGDVVVFLNDDTEWVEKIGLKELVGTATLSNVGVVGALLLYPDGHIQHAGQSMRPPDILHAYRFQRPFMAPFGDLIVAHEASGVTGACMALRREVVNDISGWSEEFPNSFNDVDLCFKVRERGLSVIQANKVKLIHHESKTRTAEVYTSHHKDLVKKWTHYINNEDFMRSDFAVGDSQNEISVVGKTKSDLTGKYVRYFFYLLKNYGLKGIAQSALGILHKATRPRNNSDRMEITL